MRIHWSNSFSCCIRSKVGAPVRTVENSVPIWTSIFVFKSRVCRLEEISYCMSTPKVPPRFRKRAGTQASPRQRYQEESERRTQMIHKSSLAVQHFVGMSDYV